MVSGKLCASIIGEAAERGLSIPGSTGLIAFPLPRLLARTAWMLAAAMDTRSALRHRQRWRSLARCPGPRERSPNSRRHCQAQ
eukprot:364505-Chlamydomonas_euryale.AAC.8